MTTLLKEPRLPRTAQHPESQVRGCLPDTGPHSCEPWPPEPDPPKPKATLGRLFELLSLYK
jgi:hypothetical protein